MKVFFISVTILILDRITKVLFYNMLRQGQSIVIIPNIFHLTLVLNKGAAFGLFSGQRILFISLSAVIVSLGIAYILRKGWKDRVLSIALGLILAGAVGNMADRIIFGYVIDFLDFRIWPVFNIADSAVTVGAFMLGWRILFKKSA